MEDTLDELTAAVRAYVEHHKTEPEKDIWDTESGEYEPGAEGCSSDWAHWEHSFERNRRFNVLAKLVGSDMKLPETYT